MTDYVKLEDIKKMLCGDCDECKDPNLMCDYQEIFNELPVIDAEPIIHGHWVKNVYNRDSVCIDKDGFPESSCYCSVCGDWLTASDEYAVRGYYCPNCGAKMDEVSE